MYKKNKYNLVSVKSYLPINSHFCRPIKGKKFSNENALSYFTICTIKYFKNKN